MKLYFISLIIIMVGGILPMLFHRRFIASKVMAVFLISVGTLTGLVDAANQLFNSEVAAAQLTWLRVLPLSFSMDSLSAYFLLPVFLIAFLAAVYSFHYLENPEKAWRTAVNYFFYSLLVVAMAMVVCADNIISFALTWEAMSIASSFLVLYDYKKKANRRAGYLYFIFTQAGAMFLFAAFGLIFARTGSFNLATAASLPENMKSLVFLLAFVGFGSKAGIFPLHIWLPHAHPAAPSHVSALMSGVMIKMGIYGIVRMYLDISPQSVVYGEIVLLFGLVSGVMGVVYAMGQHDLKRLLAYHSVENIGIILIGLGVGMLGVAKNNAAMAYLGFVGGLLHVFNHALFKSLLFMGAGAVLHRTGTVAIEQLGGLMKKMKITGISFLIGALAICGLPPFNGFVSEFLIYIGAFHGSLLLKSDFLFATLAIISLAVIGGLAGTCFTKVVGIVFLGEPRSKQARAARECGPTMSFAMVALAGCCLLVGLFPAFFVAPAVRAANLLTPTTGFAVEGVFGLCRNISRGAALFIAVFVALFGLRMFLYRRQQVEAGPTWGCGFTRPSARIQYTGSSFAAPALEFYKPLAPVREDYSGLNGVFPTTAAYHSHVEDLAEMYARKGVGLPLLRFFEWLRWIQHGHIQLYIAYIVVAIVVMLFLI